MKKAACNCLEKSIQNLDEHLSKSKKGYEKGSVRFINVPALMFDGSDNLPYMIIEYSLTDVKKKYDANVMFSHCPFCGKKYKTVEA